MVSLGAWDLGEDELRELDHEGQHADGRWVHVPSGMLGQRLQPQGEQTGEEEEEDEANAPSVPPVAGAAEDVADPRPRGMRGHGTRSAPPPRPNGEGQRVPGHILQGAERDGRTHDLNCHGVRCYRILGSPTCDGSRRGRQAEWTGALHFRRFAGASGAYQTFHVDGPRTANYVARMKSSTRRMLSQTRCRPWIDLSAVLSRRKVVATALGVMLVVGHASTGLWHRLIEVARLDAADAIKPGEAQVKVKGVRTIPLDAPGYANVMAWAPDSRRLAVGGLLDKRMSVWDVRTGQRLPGPTDQMGGTHGLAYSPDGLYLAVARGVVRSGPDKPMPIGSDRYVVSLWDGQTGAWLQNLIDETQEIGTFGVRSIAFSPSGRHLAVSYTGGLAFYTKDGVAWRRGGVLAPNAAQVAFSPDGSRLFGTIGKEILVYEVPSGRILSRWPGLRTGIEIGFPSLAISPDGQQLAVGEGARLGFFNVSSGDLTRAIEPARPHTISALSFAPNSRYVVVALGTAVYLFEASSRAAVAVLTDHRHSVDRVSVSPDGAVIAGVGGSAVTVWELSGLERAEP